MIRASAGPRVVVVATMAAVAALAWAIAYGPLGHVFEFAVGRAQHVVAALASGGAPLTGLRLYAVAFAGGLAASLSPCILGMLPVNLSYIGAQRVTSRLGAIRIATLFVAGVVVVTAAVGLVSSLFFSLFVQYRGVVNVAVGALTIAMALMLLGVVRIPLPSAITTIPRAGPFVVGLVFALVASPCASPVLVAVLAAAASSGSALSSILAMGAYAVGYTLVLWLATVFAGLAVASRRVLAHAELITRVSAAALLLLGIGLAVYGFTQM
ncbi:MAG: cytochrome c biogenesis protein CcdA [Candidatus Velthaea sp.]